ncbi:MAG TPA: efflux RND transporter periplasmic adaptor subunit [Terracidiphilus sp.]|nr:efflux RND transporter periplasmic adaptor subunit [Terracidiphilus sp.]
MDQQPPSLHASPARQPAPEPEQTAGKRRHRWVWIVVLLLFGLLFYWVISQHNKSQAATMGGGRRMMTGPVPVTLASAQRGDIGIYFNAIGTVTSVYTASITAQVTGVITAVHYREGQYVKKGDPLIDIDPRPYAAQLDQAQGLLERDQNLLSEAQMDLQRYKDAWAKNAIPRQTLEDQEKVVLQDQGVVKNDEGTVEYDKVQLDFCHITSPLNGRVGLRLVDPGNLVTANSSTTLVVVTQFQPITVVFTLNEDSLPEVEQHFRSGTPLKVEAYDRTQQKLLGTGELTTIDNQIDTASGTVKLRAEFDNRNGMLFPNQFVNTDLLVNTLKDQTLVPSSAIQHNGSTDFVFVINNAKTGKPVESQQECSTPQSCTAAMRTVKAGNSDKGNTAVQGLDPGTVVADSSFEKLQNGTQITVSKVKLPSASDGPESDVP